MDMKRLAGKDSWYTAMFALVIAIGLPLVIAGSMAAANT
jgi:hypothetical protein